MLICERAILSEVHSDATNATRTGNVQHKVFTFNTIVRPTNRVKRLGKIHLACVNNNPKYVFGFEARMSR